MKKLSKQLVTFGVIGTINTALDMGSYFLLISAGVPIALSIIVATSFGLISSLVLNRRFTFQQATAPTPQTTTKFLAVTLVGLWLLQPTVVLLARHGLGLTTVYGLTAAKLFATGISMVWNFCWYRCYVFASSTDNA